MGYQEDIKPLGDFIAGFITRWLLKLAGGVLIGMGYTESSVRKGTVGGLAFIGSLAISLFQHYKALKALPPSPK